MGLGVRGFLVHRLLGTEWRSISGKRVEKVSASAEATFFRNLAITLSAGYGARKGVDLGSRLALRQFRVSCSEIQILCINPKP